MKTIQNRDPKNGQAPEEKDQQITNPFPDEIHITDGGEFLDDSLRMKEQSLETNIKADQQTTPQTKNTIYYEMF